MPLLCCNSQASKRGGRQKEKKTFGPRVLYTSIVLHHMVAFFRGQSRIAEEEVPHQKCMIMRQPSKKNGTAQANEC